ncbi:C2 domain-containing protein / GRAM domain-containing protein isoform 1 [Hibiscus syriacus]|uniref:C2 domain-containing protein / GRAM domain-containing protein isoform 1 n=1 Tax=Hibiscus syriacus TaxID=106335 RepID=A0A6A2XM74_HIBSY|nr:C2 domain-containing protein / GRAM domain-containing protein isoform 1 [Hibiscus syriacus]
MNKFKESINNMEVEMHNQNKAPEDVEVDIIGLGCTNNNDTTTVKIEDPDATECSSSFADTTSDTDKCSGFSDAEVESQFVGDAAFGSAYEPFSSLFHIRKKRLTSHWRNFIRPLMWRCKWTELRIKQIESQAGKYTRELSAYNQRKFPGIDQSALEGFGSKSLPFSSQYNRKKAIKRRRRKRIEEATDVASYILNPDAQVWIACNIFQKTGKPLQMVLILPMIFPTQISVSLGVDCEVLFVIACGAADTDQHTDCNDKFGINNDGLFFKFRDENNSLEQVLRKIEIVHAKVQKLRNQLDQVMSKNVSKFSSSENLSFLVACDAQTSSAPSPTFSAGNGDTRSVEPAFFSTQQICKYAGDMAMSACAISSYGEAFHVPDIIESTVGLLSSAEVTCHQPPLVDSCEDIVENVLMQNEGNAGDKQALTATNGQSTKQHHQTEKLEEGESSNPSRIATSEPNNAAKKAVSQEQSILRLCLASFPKSKRNRGERKAGPVGWSRKPSGSSDALRGNSLVAALHEVMEREWTVQVRHIRRDQNRVADCLGRGAPIGVEYQDPPQLLASTLLKDLGTSS